MLSAIRFFILFVEKQQNADPAGQARKGEGQPEWRNRCETRLAVVGTNEQLHSAGNSEAG